MLPQTTPLRKQTWRSHGRPVVEADAIARVPQKRGRLVVGASASRHFVTTQTPEFLVYVPASCPLQRHDLSSPLHSLLPKS
ncbi:hypothetical protein HBH56_212100 [Parastagonospora nodorum]|uniref:Uncharacterized protein n=1 Tax=Phaeosphaeria nodorum (strain SN15 / ATCC MYA-4574 / FGSC 10173) TaxID=321614 RepID=A0A7U2NPU8_PHANO|nr:hypothetical protein HBH56_212100 [Parastagonospora nodorum]QRD06044.1 hypothetical protein JI435_134630 [Parastagonospora nodorum SN15]KAH3931563.1 hypothetical protein HBH54_100710 [Parastagonospora nodorum]KAH3944325.1 hypothetical protein HBH53_162180 [Parastagonospora nodorum]KAH4052204.1 hypothetical protein HBH49_097880 [Parastagonospora nodorum]